MRVVRNLTALAGTLALTAACLPAQTHTPASLLDRLPRVANGQYAAALKAAEARGAAGRADALWIELFYGDPAAKKLAETALAATPPPSATPLPPADQAEMAFLQFVSSYCQGQDRQMLQAALRLTRLEPNDVATELAVRTLSGQLESQGRDLLDAVPLLRQELAQPLDDPSTAYMLGHSLLAAVRAPGISLTSDEAERLAGQVTQWQLWGPFGKNPNLDFDTAFPIENTDAASFDDGGQTRTPQPFHNTLGEISFPTDWDGKGVEFAVSYIHAPAATRTLIRFYTPASFQLSVNGTSLLRNDRRQSYLPATATAAVELQAGWNRLVVKLGGESDRSFDMMLRPATGIRLESAATLPAGATLASPPRVLPSPADLAAWSTQRLASQPRDAVALWVDGIRRLQDEDPETAQVELNRATSLAPEAAPVWLNLAEAYSTLPDASASWAASQVEKAAQQALTVMPDALRAHARLGHVFLSEGKQNDAAEQFSACEGNGYADCDWSEFRLATSQHWLPESETALEHALAESGSDWQGIAEGLDFYTTMGEAAKARQCEQQLQRDPRADAALGQFYLRHARPAEAAPLLLDASRADPSQPLLRRQYVEAVLLSGNLAQARAAATQAVADFPHNAQVAAVADEIALRQSTSQGVSDLRATDYDRNSLRHEADFLAGDRFWQPWYHSVFDVIKDAPTGQQYPNASAVLVFDQMVNRINSDSSQDAYIHEVYRILNAGGIELHGDQQIPAGSDIINVRTIKADGTVLLPEKMANLDSITMPGLEPGDFVETEYIQHTPVSNVVPGAMDNDEFFVFNSSREPYHYSDLVVLSHDNMPLLIDQSRYPDPPTVKSMAGGWTAREWLVQKTRLLVTEPNMPPEQNLVPKVWVSSPITWDDISRYIADHEFDVRRTTAAMQAKAHELTAGKSTDSERADAIFEWIANNIQPGEGSMLVPAAQYFTDSAGNRMALLMAMLSAAKVPYHLVLARAVTDDSSTKIPSLYEFPYPLVHLDGAEDGAGWYDLNNEFAQPGYVVPTIRGGDGLVAGVTGAAEFIKVPAPASTLDGIVLTVTGSVADSGAATLHLQMEFRGPNGEQIRDALANQPDSRLPQIYQQLALGNYPNATATGGHVENMADKQKSLIIAIDATVPDFIHVDGSQWDLEHIAGPVGLQARYAPLPFREHPLIVPGDTFEQVKVDVTLPAKFATPNLPAAADSSNDFGRFTSTMQDSGGKLTFSRMLYLKANLIPPSQYSQFRTFAEAVDNQDRLRLTGTVR